MEKDLGYIAGVVDSDGYIGITRRKEKRRTNITECYSGKIQVTQVCPQAIELVKKYFPYGQTRVVDWSKKSKNWKNQYIWQVQKREDLVQVLSILLPYLRIKSRQARLVLNFCTLREKAIKCKTKDRDRKGRFEKEKASSKYTYSDKELKLWKQIRILNQTGG